MRFIETASLERWFERGEKFALIDVLARTSFETGHIPGSVCVPFSGDDFVKRVTQQVNGDKQRKVVLYCRDSSSDAACRASRQLEHAGFVHVFVYHGGLSEWRATGHHVE